VIKENNIILIKFKPFKISYPIKSNKDSIGSVALNFDVFSTVLVYGQERRACVLRTVLGGCLVARKRKKKKRKRINFPPEHTLLKKQRSVDGMMDCLGPIQSFQSIFLQLKYSYAIMTTNCIVIFFLEYFFL